MADKSRTEHAADFLHAAIKAGQFALQANWPLGLGGARSGLHGAVLLAHGVHHPNDRTATLPPDLAKLVEEAEALGHEIRMRAKQHDATRRRPPESGELTE